MIKYFFYRLLSSMLGPVLRLYLRLRLRRGKEDAARIEERWGVPGLNRPAGRLIWIHAASVGESASALPLAQLLLDNYADISVLITTGTKTSAEFLAPRLSPRLLHQYIPLDHPRWVRKFIGHFRPDAALWIESELWPNLIVETAQSGAKLVLLNARMSERSFESWRKMPGFIRFLLKHFTLVLAQTETYAGYFRELGAPTVAVSGNLKFAAPALPYDAAQLAALQSALDGRRVFLAASTHEGEEDMVARTHMQLRQIYPDLLTVIAPRHPARAEKIMDSLRSLNLRAAQRSAGKMPSGNDDIYLADTIGELGLFFALSRIVFVGGSLVKTGGHNLLEPARFGCAIVHGPHMHNFPDLFPSMQQAGAAQLAQNAAQLQQAVQQLLADRVMVERMGARAVEFASAQDQVLYFVGDHIAAILGAPDGAEKSYANA